MRQLEVEVGSSYYWHCEQSRLFQLKEDLRNQLDQAYKANTKLKYYALLAQFIRIIHEYETAKINHHQAAIEYWQQPENQGQMLIRLFSNDARKR